MSDQAPDPRSLIPPMDGLLGAEPVAELIDVFGRPRVVAALRRSVEGVRAEIAEAALEDRIDEWVGRAEDPGVYAGRARLLLLADDLPNLRRVVNVTGVVLHTNLGRAPLGDAASEAMRVAARGYSNLEFDLEAGRRGSRYTHCASLLTELTGAEDGLVVNNAAGALLLAVNTLARGAGVTVSRGELVEIGGGFRIPEVLERAGARLVEVGSTNRTRASDYEASLAGSDVRAVLKVHRSNFRITGFTEETGVEALAEVAGRHDLPLVHDLGSGLFMDPFRLGLPDEPRAEASLAAGADIVVVSGDKLLGGPQAGIIVGSADLIAAMRRNPLCRALRVDKGTLAALEATLRLYRDPERAIEEIPTLAMLAAPPDRLEARARDLTDRLVASGVEATAVPTPGAVGGGTFPGVELPSWAVELGGAEGGADRIADALRRVDPPIVGRIVDDRVRLDVRTLLPGQEEDLVRGVHAAVVAMSSGRGPEGGPDVGSGEEEESG